MLSPWKFRSPYTGSKKLLRSSKSVGRAVKDPLKVGSVSRDAVSGRSFEVNPDKFGRVEFRGVRGEVVGHDSGMIFKESLDLSGLVNGASVPEKDKSTLKMFEEMPEESHGLRPPDISGGVETDVKPKVFSARGKTDRRDRGYLGPVSSHLEDRSLAANTPGLSDTRDKREAALVEENDRDFKFPGLFLYAAMYGISTAVLPLRLFPWPVFPASDNSNPWLAGFSIRALGGRRLQSASGSPGLYEAGSRVRWSNHSLKPPSRESSPATSSGARLVSKAGQGSAWIPTQPVRRLSSSSSSGVRRLSNNPAFLLRLPDAFPDREAGWLAGDAVPTPFGFHGVSLVEFRRR